MTSTFDRIGLIGLFALLLILTAAQFATAADVVPSAGERLGTGATGRRDDPASALQQRLKAQIGKGAPIEHYAVGLAQAWLDYARESYFRKDGLAFKQAMGEAKAVIDALEMQGSDARADARITPSSSRLREDLWSKAASFKQHPEFRCATWQTARMEIALVAAGRAINDMGWRAARPFVKRAERFARDAEHKLNACAAPKPVAVEPPAHAPEKTIQAPPATPAPVEKTVETAPVRSLPDRVHFARDSAEIGDVSALVLEQVSYVMRANPVIVLDLRGYADELATATENENLALARAQAVRDYLIETGIGKERLVAKPEASTPTQELTPPERAKRRRVEMVPTQSDAIPIEYQDKDLSTEGPSGS
jgi:OmpA-OmpF porin, OOP family